MALPILGAAAMAAGRAVAKKLATRAVGGITGAGAKQVAPVYREMGTGSVKVVTNVKAEAKNLGVSKKVYQKASNDFSTESAASIKSGQTANRQKDFALSKNIFGNIPKKPTIKINSNK